uniref:Uncharacterized protein n=1 Tax=Aegilops tauschii subsp. strangulata TaxID=200361 RepID=A0A453IDD5_AEGTS
VSRYNTQGTAHAASYRTHPTRLPSCLHETVRPRHLHLAVTPAQHSAAASAPLASLHLHLHQQPATEPPVRFYSLLTDRCPVRAPRRRRRATECRGSSPPHRLRRLRRRAGGHEEAPAAGEPPQVDALAAARAPDPLAPDPLRRARAGAHAAAALPAAARGQA